MTSTHKKKVFHQTPVQSSTPLSQPPFILDNNLNRNVQQNPRYLDIVYHDQPARLSTTESSTSPTSTSMDVDNFSSTPVVIPSKFYYRRR